MARRSAFTTFAAFKNPLVPFFFAFLLVGDRLGKKRGANGRDAAAANEPTSDLEIAVSIVGADDVDGGSNDGALSSVARDVLEASALDGVSAALAELERNGGLAGRHVRLASSETAEPAHVVVVELTDASALATAAERDASLVLAYERALHAYDPTSSPQLASFAGYAATRHGCEALATSITSAASAVRFATASAGSSASGR